MSKIIILSLWCFSACLQAKQLDNTCLNIQKLTANKIAFFYNPKDKQDKPYFYIKTEMNSQLSPKSANEFQTGENLKYLPNTNPPIYQIPEHAKKLIIFKSLSKLDTFEPDAQIEPSTEIVASNKSIFSERPSRNVNNYPQPLPAETIRTVQNNTEIKICELIL